MTLMRGRLFARLRRRAGEMAARRNQIRTERFLLSLPEDIRRDIGYPSAFDRVRR